MKCLPEACRKTLYHAFIHSRLNYASEIYVNTTRKYIQPLISTQNKILRILQFKNIRTSINKLYKDFGILKLNDLHKFNICCIVHKFIHFPDMLPDAVSEMFCTNAQVHNYDTRHKRDINPLKTKTKSYGEKQSHIREEHHGTHYPTILKRICQVHNSRINSSYIFSIIIRTFSLNTVLNV